MEKRQRLCPTDGAVSIVYEYTNVYLNKAYPHFGINCVFVCNDLICFHNKDGPTEWHGDFKILGDDGDRIEMNFDCRGREDRLKCTILWRTDTDLDGRAVYHGYDYKGRDIKLVYKSRLQRCSRCNAWHRID